MSGCVKWPSNINVRIPSCTECFSMSFCFICKTTAAEYLMLKWAMVHNSTKDCFYKWFHFTTEDQSCICMHMHKHIIVFWAKAIMEPLWTFSTMKWTATRRERGIKIERICELMKKKLLGEKPRLEHREKERWPKIQCESVERAVGWGKNGLSDREMRVL